MRTIGKALVLAIGMSGVAVLSVAQIAQKPQFEVASIKPTTIGGPVNTPPGGMFVAAGLSLKALIQFAYRTRNEQVIGGPGWTSTDLWVIQAKAPENSVPAQASPDTTDFDAMERWGSQPDTISLMLQSLLEDRFQLKVHRETREMGVYELAVAKGGLKMKLSADQTRPEPTAPGDFHDFLSSKRGKLLVSRGEIQGQAVPFWVLFNSIRNQLDRPLINKADLNKADLNGRYDLKLKWQPDSLQSTPAGVAPEGPPLTTALQEQLGLRLESTKGPVEVIVIDSVQRPTEN